MVKRAWLLVFAILILSISAIPANAAYTCAPTCYVAKNGNNANGGTSGSPWLTIAYAASQVTAGTTVYVKAGNYNEKVSPSNSGTAGNYITYQAYPGDVVTINGNGQIPGTYDGIFHISSKNYIKVIGFKIQNSTWNGVMIDGFGGTNSTNIIIQANEISNIGYTGLYAQDGNYITFDGNTVTNTQTCGSGCGYGQQNENIDMLYVDYFEVMNNIVYGTANYESMDFKSGVNHGSIHDNDIQPGESAGIYVDARDVVSRNISIYNNRVWSNTPTDSVRGIAIGVEDTSPAPLGSARDINIYNNIIYGMGATGIAAGTAYSVGVIDNIIVANNIIYDNGKVNNWGGGIAAEYPGATNIKITNNIVDQNGGFGQIKLYSGASATVSYNLINGSSPTLGTNYRTGNPKFVNVATKDFHYQSTSPAINNGTSTNAPNVDYDGNSRPQGNAYDIGAYEYVSGGGGGGTITNAGIRWSQYGCHPTGGIADLCQGITQGGTYYYPTSYVVNSVNNMSNKFGGVQPTVIYVIGYIYDAPAGTTYLSFPHTGSVTNVTFATSDLNEANLDALDNAGVKYWLQVEPSSANMSTLIDLVYNQYYAAHSANIIGFGVDAEWWHDAEYPGGGRPVTDAEITQWQAWVKAKGANQKLFVKHWDYTNLPPTARPTDVVYIDDTESTSPATWSQLISDYASFVSHFSGYETSLQIGYPSDEDIWGTHTRPAQDIYNYTLSNATGNPLITGVYWVDFGLRKQFPDTTPPGNTAPSITGISNGITTVSSTTVTYTVNQSNALSHVKYSINSNMAGASKTTNLTSETTRHITINGLASSTKYYYQVYAFNSTDTTKFTISSVYNFTTLTPLSGNYIPPVPTGPGNTTGRYWVNHTWSAGVGNITDSYNITINGVVYTNWTQKFFNTSVVTPNGTSTIVVWSYNKSGTGTLSTASITDTVKVPDYPDSNQTFNDTINWSGYTWYIRNGSSTPGPSNWSNSSNNVWVDGNGSLHLKITDDGGTWHSASIYLNRSLGLGNYRWYVGSRVDLLDHNVVASLYTHEDNTREMNIQFSRWGIEGAQNNSRYAMQPQPPSTNMYNYGFNLSLTGDYSTHAYTWSASQVLFRSLHGHYATYPGDDYLISDWTYYNQAYIPPSPGAERTYVDLWLYQGVPPTNISNAELILTSFTFTPVPTIEFIAPTDPAGRINRNYTFVNTSAVEANNKSLTSVLDFGNSLVLWSRFNNEVGENATVFRDWSVYNHTFTCDSCPVSNTSGKFGSSKDFNNQTLSTDTEGVSDTEGTVELWAKRLGPGNPNKNDSQIAISIGSSTTSGLFDLFYQESTKNVSIRRLIPGQPYVVQYNASLNYNDWHYYAVTWNSAGNFSLYIDGQYKASGINNTALAAGSDILIGNGRNTNGGITYFTNGSIDEPRVHNRMLSGQEIAASYNGSASRLFANITGLSNGNYNVTAYTQDTDGWVGSTETRLITVGIYTPPPPINMNHVTGSNYINHTWEPGGEAEPNYGLVFSGLNYSNVTIPDYDAFSPLNTTGKMTLSFWMRPDKLIFDRYTSSSDPQQGNSIYFLGKGVPGAYEYECRMYNKDSPQRSNRISCYLFNKSGGVGTGSYFQDTITAGEWIHVVFTADGHQTSLYKNGILRDSGDIYDGGPGTYQYIIQENTGTPFRLGTGDLKSYFDGALDDVTLWNRDLNATEISALFGGTKNRTGIVAEYLMRPGSGTVLYDDSENGYDGTLYNNTQWQLLTSKTVWYSTNGYNISVNGTWHNGSNPFYNHTGLSAGAWSNISVWAYNATSGVLSTNFTSENVSVPTPKLSILSYAPPNATPIYNSTQTFNLTISKVQDVNWYFDDVLVQTNTSTMTASYAGIPSSVTTDTFGITTLYETNVSGRQWYNNWSNGITRSWTHSQNDPNGTDAAGNQFWTQDKGSGSFYTNGNGTLMISGSTPRMYVMDAAQTGKWGNVEITMYADRISDSNINWGGIEAVARTNHLVDTDVCDTRGVDARIRYDGHYDFEKETRHPSSTAIQNKVLWGSRMPFNTWIGYKYVVYDLPNGSVKLEMWYDDSNGASGGNWVKLNEFIDTGSNFATGGTACAAGIPPGMQLNLTEPRAGSESGNPNLAIYFRSDGVGTNGLWYKKVSIREINPVRVTNSSNVSIGAHNVTAIATDGVDTVSQTWTWDNSVHVIPPTPVNLTNSTGTTWVNHSWSAGAGNITDSYNVSVNGVWYNGTTNQSYNHTGLFENAWSNITIWAYNNSGIGSLSNSSITQNIRAVQTPIRQYQYVCFYPYYVNQTLYQSLNMNRCTIVPWHTINPYINGSLYKNIAGYPPTGIIANVNNVTLSIQSTNNAIQDNIFGDYTVQDNFINRTLDEIYANNFKGVDIDFEAVTENNSVTGTKNKPLIVGFARNLSKKLWENNSNYIITFDLPSKDWSSDTGGRDAIWNVTALQENVSYLMIMGYDVYYDGSSTPGPTAPWDGDYPGDFNNDFSIHPNMDHYLNNMSANKLILLVPYYGLKFNTASSARNTVVNSPYADNAEALGYTDMMRDISYNPGGTYAYDTTWKTPRYIYQNASIWRQVHYDNATSYGVKFQYVKDNGLAGAGYWAIGHDLNDELESIVGEYFGTPYIPPAPINLTNTTDLTWVNHTWQAGAGNITNSYNVNVNGTWYNGTTNTFYNHTGLLEGAWSNITIWAYNSSSTGTLSTANVSQNVQVQLTNFTPATPTNLQNTKGTTWVNHTWSAGAGNITNSYNVSVNGTWYNGTTNTFYNHTGLVITSWSNIAVWAYNNSGVGQLSASSAGKNVQLTYILPVNGWEISNANFTIHTNGTNTTFPTTQLYTSIETGASYIELNGSRLHIIPTSPTNVSVNGFDTVNHVYNVTPTSEIAIAHRIPAPNINKYFVFNGGTAVATNSTGYLTKTFSTTQEWNITGKTLGQINKSVNLNQSCLGDILEYIDPIEQVAYIFTCGLTANESTIINRGEGFWVNSTDNLDVVRNWSDS